MERDERSLETRGAPYGLVNLTLQARKRERESPQGERTREREHKAEGEYVGSV